MRVATYQRPWPPSPGRFRVATYRGNFERSPIVYHPADYFDHRTLKAAVRRLASLIHKGGRLDRYGKPLLPKYDSLYIILPDGRRLSLSDARKWVP